MTHPNLTELLAIRDGEPSSANIHVSSCQVCQDELIKIEILVDELHRQSQTPELKVPDNAWQNILANNKHSPNPKMSASPASLTRAVYALAASILLVGFALLWSNFQSPALPLISALPELKAESSVLEDTLANYQNGNVELSAEQQFKIEKIQWNLMLLDQRLILSNQRQNKEELEDLWAKRIQDLTSLHAVYNNNPTVMQPLAARSLL